MRTCEISIVVQGAVSKGITASCLSSLRECFPGAEIILSTWKGSDIAGLSYDKVVLSTDPGTFVADKVTGSLNNVNRQLLSTQAGLKVATRPYILKTRTDILVQSADFLNFHGKYDDAPSPYFRSRLLICNYFTRCPRVISTCYHPSDWIVFGHTEDVCKYYEKTSFMTEDEGNWFQTRTKASTFFTNFVCRYTPEQQLFLGFLRQYEDVDFDCYYERSRSLIKQTERLFAQCFIVLDYGSQMNIKFVKYNPNRYMEKFTLISHWQWKAIFQRYCLGRLTPLWVLYRFRGMIFNCMTGFRTLSIRMLDMIGMKERVKRFFNRS